MSKNRISRQIVVHPYNGILLINKRNKLLTDETTQINLKNTMSSEMNQMSQRHTCNSSYMTSKSR